MKKINESMLEENFERLITAALDARLSERRKSMFFQTLVSRIRDRSVILVFPWQAVVGLAMLMILAGIIVLSRWGGSISLVNPPVVLMFAFVGINVVMLPIASILIIFWRRHAQ